MRIDTEEMRDGKYTGQEVWICQYLRPDIDKKPLRNVPPTKVLIVSNDEITSRKTIYYSKDHFRPISKTGKVLSKIISPVDTTGFRSYCGNQINIFDNQAECYHAWNSELNECMDRLQIAEDTAAESWRKQRLDLGEMAVFMEVDNAA